MLLEAPISIDEVKNAIWACSGDRALGPDGFTFKFLKTYWNTFYDGIMDFIRYFEFYGKLAKGCNSSFITLIPKVKDPVFLSKFRSISLIGPLYKIITKVLAIYLKAVIGN